MTVSHHTPSPVLVEPSYSRVALLSPVAIVKAADLEAQGIPCTSSPFITFQHTELNRGQSFSLRFRQAAIALAQTHLQTGVHCLLIESPLHITLWYERA